MITFEYDPVYYMSLIKLVATPEFNHNVFEETSLHHKTEEETKHIV